MDSPYDRLVTLPEELPEYTLGWEVVRWATKYIRHPQWAAIGKALEVHAVSDSVSFALVRPRR